MRFADATGVYWDFDLGGITENKRTVITRAISSGRFWVVEHNELYYPLFECEWCKAPVTISGVQADHLLPQRMQNSQSRDVQILYRESDPSGHGLMLSCSTCNQGVRNRSGTITRSAFRHQVVSPVEQGGND